MILGAEIWFWLHALSRVVLDIEGFLDESECAAREVAFRDVLEREGVLSCRACFGELDAVVHDHVVDDDVQLLGFGVVVLHREIIPQ